MKLLQVKITSKQTIKPSSPTPPHLKTFNFSILDQLIPAPYAPLILFYPQSDAVFPSSLAAAAADKIRLLKSSLSDVLTSFYPLAGTISPDDLSIDCNDKGVSFVEARTDCSMTQFLARPDLLSLRQLLPVDPGFLEPEQRQVSNVQVTEFSCGGIAIAVCISHKILDGVGLSTFLKAWTTAARRDTSTPVVVPNFVAGTLFPARGSTWLRDASMPLWGSFFRTGKCVTRRIVFDSKSIESLKDQVAAAAPGSHPTRVEIVSAFLWKSLMEVTEKLNGGIRKTSVLTHLVNLRKRVEPPMSENSMGNLLWISSAKSDPTTERRGLGELAGRVRESISKIDDGFVRKMRGKEGKSAMVETMAEIIAANKKGGTTAGADYLGFSSWCRMGFYGSDFGWGDPVWISSYGLEGSVFLNLVMLADTRCGKGIEAWVTMDEAEIAAMAADPEMVEFAKFDPSPLSII
ncbi:Stemmadenine O-acetyltransferase [Linum grandiflorum]